MFNSVMDHPSMLCSQCDLLNLLSGAPPFYGHPIFCSATSASPAASVSSLVCRQCQGFPACAVVEQCLTPPSNSMFMGDSSVVQLELNAHFSILNVRIEPSATSTQPSIPRKGIKLKLSSD